MEIVHLCLQLVKIIFFFNFSVSNAVTNYISTYIYSYSLLINIYVCPYEIWVLEPPLSVCPKFNGTLYNEVMRPTKCWYSLFLYSSRVDENDIVTGNGGTGRSLLFVSWCCGCSDGGDSGGGAHVSNGRQFIILVTMTILYGGPFARRNLSLAGAGCRHGGGVRLSWLERISAGQRIVM